MRPPPADVDALVVGGGPAGLAAATSLRDSGVGIVVVVEREDEAGGVPRHCHHTGFGLRDHHRVLRGPAYADRWVGRAEGSGVVIRTQTMVTGWSDDGRAEVTGPAGRQRIRARAVVLATGARERPRSARLVPGTRPNGIFTTGQLQQWVHLERLPVGERAVIVGAELVSYSAALTLREAGVHPVAMVTAHPRSQVVRLVDTLARVGLRMPVWTETTVAAIEGRDRVDAVQLSGPAGRAHRIPVDTVVFTGEWIPDHELARLAGLGVDAGTNGPASDADGATSRPGFFAAGNLVHPVETADVAACRAAWAGAAAARWLRGGDGEGEVAPRPVHATAPLRWVAPNLVRPGGGVGHPTLLRTDAFLDRPLIRVEQGDRLLAGYRLRHLTPNCSHHIPSDWTVAVDPSGDEIRISALPGR